VRKVSKKKWVFKVKEDYETRVVFRNFKGEIVKEVPTIVKAGTYQSPTKKKALAAIQAHNDAGGDACLLEVK
jgi:hypothetical protein